MKKWIVISVVSGMLAVPNLYSEEHKHEHAAAAATGTQTVQGEVLDMACYMMHDGKGPKHKSCAVKCIKDGAPLGLLTKEGKVYLLLEDHSSPKPYAQMKDWAAENVSVKGEVQEKGGVQAIVVQSSEKIK